MKDSLFVGSWGAAKRGVLMPTVPDYGSRGCPGYAQRQLLTQCSRLSRLGPLQSCAWLLVCCLEEWSLLALSCVSHSSVIAQGAAVHFKTQQRGSVMPRKCCFFSEWVSLSLTFPSNDMLLLGKHVPVKAGLLPQEDCAEAVVLAWAQLPAPWMQTGTVTGFRLEPSSPIGLHSGDPWCFSSPCGWASLTSMRPTWRR